MHSRLLGTVLICSWLLVCQVSRSEGHPQAVLDGSLSSEEIRHAREQLAGMLGLSVAEADALERRVAAQRTTDDRDSSAAAAAAAAAAAEDGEDENRPPSDPENVNSGPDSKLDTDDSGIQKFFSPVSEPGAQKSDIERLARECNATVHYSMLRHVTLVGKRVHELYEDTVSGQGHRMLFDFTSWPDSESVKTAEIILAPWHVARFMAEDPHAHPVVDIVVQGEGSAADEDSSSPRVSRLFFLHGKEWYKLNITSIVSKWPKREGDHSLKITVSPGPPVHDAEGVLNEFKPNFTEPIRKKSTAPRLYVESHKTTQVTRGEAVHRVRRASEYTFTEQENRECYQNSFHREQLQMCSSYCKRFSIVAMGWMEFLIAPREMELGYCAGPCTHPLGASVPARHLLDHDGQSTVPVEKRTNITTHARLQALMSVSAGIPAPFCVPIAYSQITIIYQDDYLRVVIKNIPDGLVRDCGCA